MFQVFVFFFCLRLCLGLNLYQCPWGFRVLVSVRFHFDVPLLSVLVFHMSCRSHLCTSNRFFDVSASTALALCTCQYSADVHWLW